MQFGHLNGRKFTTLLSGAAVAWPHAARAQSGQGTIPRVGVLMGNNEADPETSSRVAAFEGGLQKVGLAKGRNVLVHYRFAVNNAEQDRNAVSEIIGLRPDVILAHTPSTLAALRRATRTIPIVFVQAADPVEVGLVSNLTTPEGNGMPRPLLN
jgi:putative ABC transport system substrate-binding protein